MSESILRKLWVTPLTALFFIAVAVTGVLLLCEIKSHALKECHEGAGVLFTIGGLLHLIKNHRGLAAYFKKK